MNACVQQNYGGASPNLRDDRPFYRFAGLLACANAQVRISPAARGATCRRMLL